MKLITQLYPSTAIPGVCMALFMIGSASGTSLVSEYNQIANTIEVNYIGTDQHVHQFWFNGTWHPRDLTAGTGAPNAAMGSHLASEFNSIANTVEVNYIGTDQHVHQFWFNGTWHTTDLTAATGAPNAATGSALASEFNSIAKTIEVNYIATDQHVHQLWYSGTWQTRDLNAGTGAPNAASGSSLVSEFNPVAIPNTVEVNYIGTDQHVHQFWFNGTWHTSDLTAGTGAPNAAGGSSLASVFDKIANAVEVDYTGADQHVHQLFFNGSWHTTDLTTTTGGLNAASGSSLVSEFNSVASPNSVEVNYVGTDRHIHQFWSNGTWHKGDLTSGTGAPNAAAESGLASEFNSILNVVEVNYIGSDQHVHQFWFNGTWHTQDLTAATGSLNAAPATAAAGFIPLCVAFDGANIWVTDNGSNKVTKLRASDGTELGTFAVGDGAQGVAFDGNNIWS